MSDPFAEAMDDAEASEQQTDRPSLDEFDVEPFLEAMNDGEASKSVSVRVTPEMKTFWHLLKEEDIDVHPPQAVREWITTQAKRHPEIADKAGRIHQIKNE